MPDIIETVRILAAYERTRSTNRDAYVNNVLINFVADVLDVSPDRVLELLDENAQEIELINAPD